MKRIILLLIAVWASASGALAQKGLAINQLFDGRYRKDSQAVETTLRGAMIRNYDLETYRSITITGREDDADLIERLIAQDAKGALDSEESNKGGKLYYAFYRLPRTGTNRYILYLNQQRQGGDKIVLIYLEGDATPADIKKMFKHK